MDQPIVFPRIYSRRTTGRFATIGGQSGFQEGATAYPAYSFVKMAGGYLVPIATAEATAVGAFDYYQSTGATGPTVQNPPYALMPAHWPFEIRDTQFAVNITDSSGHVGQANSAPALSAVTVGSTYGVYVFSSGANKGIACLNSADTTNAFFRIVDIPLRLQPGSLITPASTYNGIVIVEILSTLIQQLG